MKSKPIEEVALTVAVAMVFATGCVSKSTQPSAESVPTTVQTPDAGAILDGLIAMNDAKNPMLSDEDLIKKFENHRTTFERLRRMISEDPKLHRVGHDWTAPKNPKDAGVSPERIDEYRQLLEKVGCPAGFFAYPTRPGIYFISAAQGIAVNSQDQGFYYYEGTPNPVVTNITMYRAKQTADSYRAFREIGGHWYVYYARN